MQESLPYQGKHSDAVAAAMVHCFEPLKANEVCFPFLASLVKFALEFVLISSLSEIIHVTIITRYNWGGEQEMERRQEPGCSWGVNKK